MGTTHWLIFDPACPHMFWFTKVQMFLRLVDPDVKLKFLPERLPNYTPCSTRIATHRQVIQSRDRT